MPASSTDCCLDQSAKKGHHTADHHAQLLSKLVNICVSNPLTCSVDDVAATVEFYEQAFGVKKKMVTQAFAQLDTGDTALAFGWTENEKRELGRQGYRANSPDTDPAGAQISFISENVEADYARAIKAGARPVYEPQLKPWGQWVCRVRDCNGFLVSIVTAPKF